MNSKGTNELDLVVSNTQIATQSQTKTYESKREQEGWTYGEESRKMRAAPKQLVTDIV